MIETIERVKISEFRVERSPGRLKISGLGSCVALAIYDPRNKIGGLAHILLPGPAPKGEDLKPASAANPGRSKYADQAVTALREALIAAGAAGSGLVAKIAGGANMFQAPPGAEADSPVKAGIGERNVEAVRRHLAEKSLVLAGEDVGGNTGRNVVFDLENGDFIVVNPRGQKIIL